MLLHPAVPLNFKKSGGQQQCPLWADAHAPGPGLLVAWRGMWLKVDQRAHGLLLAPSFLCVYSRFICLKGKLYREGQRTRTSILLIHSRNAASSGSPTWVAGAQALSPSSAAFPGVLTGSWIRRGAAFMGWQHCGWQLHPLYPNMGASCPQSGNV